jgi:hypothetical protein
MDGEGFVVGYLLPNGEKQLDAWMVMACQVVKMRV